MASPCCWVNEDCIGIVATSRLQPFHAHDLQVYIASLDGGCRCTFAMSPLAEPWRWQVSLIQIQVALRASSIARSWGCPVEYWCHGAEAHVAGGPSKVRLQHLADVHTAEGTPIGLRMISTGVPSAHVTACPRAGGCLAMTPLLPWRPSHLVALGYLAALRR